MTRGGRRPCGCVVLQKEVPETRRCLSTISSPSLCRPGYVQSPRGIGSRVEYPLGRVADLCEEDGRPVEIISSDTERLHEEQPGTTSATGLNVPGGIGYFRVLEILYEPDGDAVAVREDAIEEALAGAFREAGWWVCLEGAACLAALEPLVERGTVRPGDEGVVFGTASLEKYLPAARHVLRCGVAHALREDEGGSSQATAALYGSLLPQKQLLYRSRHRSARRLRVHRAPRGHGRYLQQPAAGTRAPVRAIVEKQASGTRLRGDPVPLAASDARAIFMYRLLTTMTIGKKSTDTLHATECPIRLPERWSLGRK